MDNYERDLGGNINLALVCAKFELYEYVQLNGKPPRALNDWVELRASLVEAILGAVYLDSGPNIDKLKAVMKRLHLLPPVKTSKDQSKNVARDDVTITSLSTTLLETLRTLLKQAKEEEGKLEAEDLGTSSALGLDTGHRERRRLPLRMRAIFRRYH
jgi:hypothetical protein